MTLSIEAFLTEKRALVEQALGKLLPPEEKPPSSVHRAMRYTLMLPGKRLRALVLLASGGMLRAPEERLVPAACQVEMVHAASLILDDLPCMDGATLRRGVPANHLVFGEATAILAAFALLNRAYGIGPEEGTGGGWEPQVAARVAGMLAGAVGTEGLIGGQSSDLESTGTPLDFEALEYIHSHKTGSLFIAAAEIGGFLGDAGDREMEALHRYAKNLGLAFQITDDLLDATGSPKTTGKDCGLDQRKTTFVAFAGLEGARRLADELIDASRSALEPLGEKAATLAALAENVRFRVR